MCEEKQQPTKAPTNGLDDDFLMHSYKVVPCKRKYAHDWASCPCGHKGERAARRDLQTNPYMAIACHYAKQRMACPLGDRCPHAHNLFEYWLHPSRYKTELCQYGSNCDRPVCFFGHSLIELRPLDPNLPPAEACWSAGAALGSKGQQSMQHRYKQQQQLQQQQHLQQQHMQHQHLQLQQQQQQQHLQQQQPYMPAPTAVPGFAAQHPAADTMLQGQHGMMLQQQGPQVMMLSAGSYSSPAGTSMSSALHPQQLVLLQPGQQLGGSLPHGLPSAPLGPACLPVGSAGTCYTLQPTPMLQQQQVQQQPPPLQQQQQQHMQYGAYSSPASSQGPYVWLQVPEGSGSSSGSSTSSNTAAYLSSGGLATLRAPGLVGSSGVGQPHSPMLDCVVAPQLTAAAPGAICQPSQMQQQQQQQQQPHQLRQGLGGLVDTGALGSPAAGAAVVVCAALAQAHDLQNPSGPSNNPWQYALYPTVTTQAQVQSMDGVLVGLQGMQLAPGL